ncbi:MAG: hypothetical protein IKV87_04800 [Methanobrevibacter sp.]|nr:hypothetical protein [Methanobrevibacter sp.]
MVDNKVLKSDVINIDPNEPELNPEFVEEVLKNEGKSKPSIVKDLDELFD